MKEDLKMKLGDRRRLSNYCRYLSEIHSDEKKKKEYRKASSLRKIDPEGRKGASLSIESSHKESKFKTGYID